MRIASWFGLAVSRRRRRRVLAIGLLSLIGAATLWTWWAEGHPRQERQLRVLVHDRLAVWFPREMAPDDGWHGIHLRDRPAGASVGRVLLIHGLDEPGSIWDDLVPALGGAGYEVWELRYPNDQGIDRSADYLAQHWLDLPPGRPVVLIGHSMGGLVARDFVSRLRHPVGAPARVAGTSVAGAILVGTPNQGSEWARLRVWLELRDQFPTGQGRRFSLFAALRDGTGEAKIDLRPGSDFLRALNARPWPAAVPIRVIEGQLLDPPADLSTGLAAAAAEVQSDELRQRLRAWWSGIGQDLGDGVVTLESARLPNGAPPLVLNASHRGLLLRQLPGAPEPPAIAPILQTLHDWRSMTPAQNEHESE
ncbi:alpha/beta fold hydrolase [uncultured Thiodictyon sp.]|uniref:esterase/lipase family protein n=1 Tax=uncultured Thiodictyon sp. TaxID=1846217 RepID=UPI0025D767B4|nr:alpha/beta fold hydrolase [uncultured Thiodictyon sp.]